MPEPLGTREEQKAKMKEMHEIAMRILGKDECDDCFNRGYANWDMDIGQYVPCPSCILKAAQKARTEKKKELVTENQAPESLN